MPRPNWFFAFPFAGEFVLRLPDPPARFRRFHPDDVHLTLAFLGGCGEEKALRGLTALDELMPVVRPAPLDVSLGSVVPMGKARAYTALSALLADGREEAEGYLAAMRDALLDAAVGRREKRPPKPHVTVARPMRLATDAQRAAGLEWARGLDLSQVRGKLDRIALYTWSEIRRERLFRIVAMRELG